MTPQEAYAHVCRAHPLRARGKPNLAMLQVFAGRDFYYRPRTGSMELESVPQDFKLNDALPYPETYEEPKADYRRLARFWADGWQHYADHERNFEDDIDFLPEGFVIDRHLNYSFLHQHFEPDWAMARFGLRRALASCPVTLDRFKYLTIHDLLAHLSIVRRACAVLGDDYSTELTVHKNTLLTIERILVEEWGVHGSLDLAGQRFVGRNGHVLNLDWVPEFDPVAYGKPTAHPTNLDFEVSFRELALRFDS